MTGVVLITGANGKLGREVARNFPGALTPTHAELEVADKEKVAAYIAANKPNLVIHLAAATDVRKCETEKEWAYNINVRGTENLVEACRLLPDCVFVYMSTACVFYGDRGNYTEEDLPYPKNFYSLTKLLGEFVVRTLPNHLILRGNFVARERWPFPKAFTDRFGTYLFAEDLAKAIKELLEEGKRGLLHVVGEDRLSMYELAKITTPEVGEMTMESIDLPLTKDMTLRSVRIPAYKITRTPPAP